MTIVRNKFYARITEFEAQLEGTTEFEAQHTTSLGNKEVVSYRVTSQEGVVFRVELGERTTRVKCWFSSSEAEFAINVHPTRALEGLRIALNLVKASVALSYPAT